MPGQLRLSGYGDRAHRRRRRQWWTRRHTVSGRVLAVHPAANVVPGSRDAWQVASACTATASNSWARVRLRAGPRRPREACTATDRAQEFELNNECKLYVYTRSIK